MIKKAVLLTIQIAMFYAFMSPPVSAHNPVNKDQFTQYNENKPKTIIELQPFRSEVSIDIQFADGKFGKATLINLNPNLNVWYLLIVQKNGKKPEMYHLENPFPENNTLELNSELKAGLVISTREKNRPCERWAPFSDNPPAKAKKSAAAFEPLCDNMIYLRNPTQGKKTALEATTDFLRRHVAGGEQITTIVKDLLFKDRFVIDPEVVKGKPVTTNAATPPNGPAAADIEDEYKNTYLVPKDLGLPVENNDKKGLACGQWYPVKNHSGIFFSAIQPKMVSKKIVAIQKKKVKILDSVEASALVYLVAIDQGLYELGYALGTEHPSVEWSKRIRPEMRNDTLPGPDGIDTIEPLVNTGIVPPNMADRVVATFTSGFKRYHGAFRNGKLAKQGNASHYGFMSNGVIFSKLHPGLATIVVYKDGKSVLKTWTKNDAKSLSTVRHARQNGVPIIAYDQSEARAMPTRFIRDVYEGNWSGSAEGHYRTLRAGLGEQKNKSRRFLIYAWFSSTTPSAMARVFQAYDCNYAMQTDINALEHTYMALYDRSDGFKIHHLNNGMNVLDKTVKKKTIPRFLGMPDNRDFFYLMEKKKK